MNIAYRIVVSYAYSHRTALQRAQSRMYQRSAVKSAPYGNISFVEIVAHVGRGVVFEIERHDARVLRGVEFYVFDLFKTVEQFACQIASV